MECNFHVGQKVVCVAEPINPQIANLVKRAGYPYPEVGEVVTIRSIYMSRAAYPEGPGEPEPFLRFQEYTMPTIESEPGVYGEGGFVAKRFRPLVEKGTETGMAILKEILNTQKVPELV